MSDVSEDFRRLRQLDFFEGREFAVSDGAPPRSDELIDARDLRLRPLVLISLACRLNSAGSSP